MRSGIVCWTAGCCQSWSIIEPSRHEHGKEGAHVQTELHFAERRAVVRLPGKAFLTLCGPRYRPAFQTTKSVNGRLWRGSVCSLLCRRVCGYDQRRQPGEPAYGAAQTDGRFLAINSLSPS